MQRHEAYVQAGYKAKNKNAAMACSHKLINTPIARVRLGELTRETILPAIPAKESIVKRLVAIADNPEAKDSDRIAAMRQISLMAGYNAPTRQETLTVQAKFSDIAPGNPEFSRRLNAAHQILTKQIPHDTETPASPDKPAKT